ncbi:unnamed protein product [Amoebophrya sp. A120]|nr:unnamed protein product [Amoebophrya sp. A120]|eukprot:GSA120T00016480001.1
MHRYEHVGHISEGRFGSVSKAVTKDTQDYVAIKEVYYRDCARRVCPVTGRIVLEATDAWTKSILRELEFYDPAAVKSQTNADELLFGVVGSSSGVTGDSSTASSTTANGSQRNSSSSSSTTESLHSGDHRDQHKNPSGEKNSSPSSSRNNGSGSYRNSTSGAKNYNPELSSSSSRRSQLAVADNEQRQFFCGASADASFFNARTQQVVYEGARMELENLNLTLEEYLGAGAIMVPQCSPLGGGGATGRGNNEEDMFIHNVLDCTSQIFGSNLNPMLKHVEGEMNQHPNIVKMLSHFRSPQQPCYYLVYEFCEMDLYQVLNAPGEIFSNLGSCSTSPPMHPTRTPEGVKLSESQVKRLTFQLLNGLQELHVNRKVMHRDLKPSNLLLHKDGLLKIADFGSACLIPEKPIRAVSKKEPAAVDTKPLAATCGARASSSSAGARSTTTAASCGATVNSRSTQATSEQGNPTEEANVPSDQDRNLLPNTADVAGAINSKINKDGAKRTSTIASSTSDLPDPRSPGVENRSENNSSSSPTRATKRPHPLLGTAPDALENLLGAAAGAASAASTNKEGHVVAATAAPDSSKMVNRPGMKQNQNHKSSIVSTGAAANALTREICTRWYKSPELLYGSYTYDEKIDIWAVGCIIYELMQHLKTNSSPHSTSEDHAVPTPTARSPSQAPGAGTTTSHGEQNAPPQQPSSGPQPPTDEMKPVLLAPTISNPATTALMFDFDGDEREDFIASAREAVQTNKVLFDGDCDIQQLGKIFHCLGTVKHADWPEVRALPDYGKIQFIDIPAPPNQYLEKKPFDDDSLVAACIKLNPKHRAEVGDLLMSSWFAGVVNNDMRHDIVAVIERTKALQNYTATDVLDESPGERRRNSGRRILATSSSPAGNASAEVLLANGTRGPNGDVNVLVLDQDLQGLNTMDSPRTNIDPSSEDCPEQVHRETATRRGRGGVVAGSRRPSARTENNSSTAGNYATSFPRISNPVSSSGGHHHDLPARSDSSSTATQHTDTEQINEEDFTALPFQGLYNLTQLQKSPTAGGAAGDGVRTTSPGASGTTSCTQEQQPRGTNKQSSTSRRSFEHTSPQANSRGPLQVNSSKNKKVEAAVNNPTSPPIRPLQLPTRVGTTTGTANYNGSSSTSTSGGVIAGRTPGNARILRNRDFHDRGSRGRMGRGGGGKVGSNLAISSDDDEQDPDEFL